MQLYSEEGSSKVQWVPSKGPGGAVTWYKVTDYQQKNHKVQENNKNYTIFSFDWTGIFQCPGRYQPSCYQNDEYGEGNDLGQWPKHWPILGLLPLSH